MAINRIGTGAHTNFLTNQILSTQKRVTELQIQVGTGKRAQRYSGLAADSLPLTKLEASWEKVNQYSRNIDTTLTRTQFMESQITSIVERLTDFKTTLINAGNDDNYNELPLVEFATDTMDAITGFLNFKDASNRYLFSGGKTNVAPVDLSSFATAVDPLVANFEYYQGDDINLSMQADESLRVTYGVRANRSGFEEALRAARNIIANPFPAGIDQSIDLIDSAIEDLTSATSEIGSAMTVLERAKSKHSDFLLRSEEMIGSIENVDVAEMVTRLSTENANLEAGLFVVTRLLSGNTILNFLQ